MTAFALLLIAHMTALLPHLFNNPSEKKGVRAARARGRGGRGRDGRRVVALPALQVGLQRLGLEDAARQVLEGDGRPPLALGVRARVVQALFRQRRVARHIPIATRRKPRRLRIVADPLRRPKDRIGRAHLALQLPEERASHAIVPPIAQLLLLLWWGALLLCVVVCVFCGCGDGGHFFV